MDFALSEEQQLIFDTAYAFGQEAIAPHAYEWEKAGTMPREVFRSAAELGFGGLFVPEEQGGSGLGRLDATLIFEALAAACPSIAAFLSIHNMCTLMIARYGSDESRERWLAKLVTMEAIASYCLTEPGSGSDAAALRMRAEKNGNGYVLNGTKAFISGGGYSDLYIVMCRTGDQGPKGVSSILVEDGTAGLSFGALEQKMGWKAQPTAEVQMDDCVVDGSNLLGEEGLGFTYAMEGLDGGRLNIAACSLGGAQAALGQALGYVNERKAFGKTLSQFQGLQFRLADMATELEAARTLLRQAAWKLDQGAADATPACAMAKRFVTDTGFDVANGALQLLGGYGYLEDYGIEKIVRDLRVHQILEGTNEIMRVIISRSLLGGVATS